MKWPEKGEAVAIVQQALIELGFSLPFTNKSGSPDGICCSEKLKAVQAFQENYGLIQDGVVGKQTMGKLDSMPPGKVDPKPFSSMYCMMRSWKVKHRIRSGKQC